MLKSYIGGKNWIFSDEIYFKLSGTKVNSKFNPELGIFIMQISDIIPNKELYGLFWDSPTFKYTDCLYHFHVYDNIPADYIISTSSGNTVEAMARAVKFYNLEKNKHIKAILLVPELSAYKISKSAIINNPYIHYVVLKNSTLDSIRVFAEELNGKLSKQYKVISSDGNLKTAAYSQIGLALKNLGIFDENSCYVQTVSGGVGPAGVIESAFKLNENPEILLVQPHNGKSAPIVDALKLYTIGKEPFSIFQENPYKTSELEPTLGSTKPIYAIEKYIEWLKNGGRIIPSQISNKILNQYRKTILSALIKLKIYPNAEIGEKIFELEKSGFLAFAAAIRNTSKIEAERIIVNFTGRYLESNSTLPESVTPHLTYDPVEGVNNLIKKLNNL